jgi:putative tryptophan/tyrosine transport system substrate-binding protein
MSKEIFIWLLATMLQATFSPADAQQPVKVPRIGYLLEVSPSGGAILLDAFRQGLRDLGYIEGKNFVIESRWAENLDRLPPLAVELVQLKVDIIVTASTPPTLAAQKATKTIPIVVAHMSDPVEAGLVASLARPGGNVTGSRSLQAELGGKRLEVLKEAFPMISRVAVMGSFSSGGRQQMKEMEGAAQVLGLELRPLEWKRAATDFQRLFRALTEMRANAFTTISGSAQLDYTKQIVELPAKNRLPAIYTNKEFVEAGGLMSYGTKPEDFHRRAAYFVDKILKGAKPADLPVEQPTKFEFVINLKAAKQIGLTIPPNVLARADRVIR